MSKKMKKALSLILALGMLFTLAACGGDSGSDTDSSDSADSGGDTYKVGMIYPMSGSNALFGTAMADATQIAVDRGHPHD